MSAPLDAGTRAKAELVMSLLSASVAFAAGVGLIQMMRFATMSGETGAAADASSQVSTCGIALVCVATGCYFAMRIRRYVVESRARAAAP